MKKKTKESKAVKDSFKVQRGKMDAVDYDRIRKM